MNKKYLRWAFLSACVGGIAGLASTLFLYGMNWVWRFQMSHHEIIFFLPLAAVLITLVYQKYARDFSDGGALVFEEIHEPKKVLPVRIAPLVFLGTLLSHFVGASPGREGTAVQVSASLTDQLSKIFNIENAERKILLVAGSGAGFGTAVGAPWAGIIFGMEMIYIGRLQIFAPVECFIASFVAFAVSVFLKAPHDLYPRLSIGEVHAMDFLWVVVAGAVFGLTARAFVKTRHFVGESIKKMKLKSVWLNFIGGTILCILFYEEASYHYCSLGIKEIQNSLQTQVSFLFPLFKFVSTILSLSSGFKGGEFVPLVFIGSHLGSALSQWLPVSSSLLASVGFSAVFAGAANVPITCTVLSIEIFGWSIAPYACLACLMSYYFSGGGSIYHGQKKSSHHKLSPWLEVLFYVRKSILKILKKRGS